jgi:threonine dehydratase
MPHSPRIILMFTLAELESAAELVHSRMFATPTYAWPLLSRLVGTDVWVKHENHTPIGAFKARGGIVYMDDLKRSGRPVTGVITATRGNHGQSIARAAAEAGLSSTILVPHGNSTEKNSAMRAFGARVIEHGVDFDEAKAEAVRLAEIERLHMVPSFHPALVKGVATYGLELFRAKSDLAAVYVPIGLGSGICGLIAARDLLGLKTEIIGVVAENAPAYALSFAEGRPVPTNSARTFADGMAVRGPDPGALAMILRGASGVVRVSEDQIAEAMRNLYEATHNVAEGAGAAALAALTNERERWRGRPVAIILSGGNVDRPVFETVLAGKTPAI